MDVPSTPPSLLATIRQTTALSSECIGTTGTCCEPIAIDFRALLRVTGTILDSKFSELISRTSQYASTVLTRVKVMTWGLQPIARFSFGMHSERTNSFHYKGTLLSAKCHATSADHNNRGGLGNPQAGPAYGEFVWKYDSFCQSHMTDGMAIYWNVPSM